VEEVPAASANLIFLDTHWWLQKSDSLPYCAQDNAAEVVAELNGQLEAAKKAKRRAIVLAHHPLASYGKHGGFKREPGKNWLPAWLVGHQDVGRPKNKEMVEDLHKALAAHPPLLYAAGHDHSLQVLKGTGGAAYVAVSGSGSKTSAVTRGKGITLFAHGRPGFMMVYFWENGEVWLSVVEPEHEGTVFSIPLN
jgi:hypothetical protein